MRIKWERKVNDTDNRHSSYCLSVYLVDGRHDQKDTKQVAATCLASIDERFLITKARDIRAFHKGLFWKAVEERLDHLDIETTQRVRIESQIAEKISRPDKEWSLWAVTCIPRYDPD